MSYSELIRATRPAKTAFGERFVEFLQAGLSQEIIDAVNYNIIAYQQARGDVRTDRMVPQREVKMSNAKFHDREKVIMMNDSDGKVLRQLNEFRAENSLDMDEVAQQWFDYITDGVIGPALGDALRNGDEKDEEAAVGGRC